MDDTVLEAIEELKNDPDVEYATPNYVFEFQANITDPEYTGDNQWGAEKIQLQEAMNEMTGTIDDVVVAVLDTGLSLSHPEFGSGNLWDGSGSCEDENGNSISGGCPNHGWDFVSGDNNPQDDYGHGTNVAGIIGAIKNNTGIAGTSSNVKMMIVKVGTSYGSMTQVAQGINFARENEAKIINASFGGKVDTGTSDEIVSFLNGNMSLFVAGAGNEKNDNDSLPFYPASYDLEGIISVAATESDDGIWDDLLTSDVGSNWGAERVDLAAPGHNIRTTEMNRGTLFEANFIDILLLPTLDGFVRGTESPNTWGAMDWASGVDLYTDAFNYPDDDQSTTHYTTDVEASVISPSIDLSSGVDDTSVVHFDVWCDTEPKGSKSEQPDYLDVFAVAPSLSPFKLNVAGPIHEGILNKPEERNGLMGAISAHTSNNKGLGYVIPDDYVTSSTQIKFVWHTDSGDTGGPYRGCAIDNVKVMIFDEDTYADASGTSLSAPFVTGVATMIWGKYPDLTATQVKQIIMDSGDAVADLHPVTGGHPIKSGKRLNAYKALLMAADVNDQVQAGQGLILYPTIHSKTTGGNWNTAGTWVENRVPNSSDVVEINGAVTVNVASAEVAGLIINNGKSIINQYNTSRYLTINGPTVNNGSVSDDTSGYALFMRPRGDIENNGSWLPRYTNLDSTGSRSFTGTTPISSPSNGQIQVLDDIIVTGDSKIGGIVSITTGSITVDSPDSLSFYGDLINVTGGILGDGTIKLSGAAQNFGGGDITTSELVIEGTGVKTMTAGMTLNGDLTIGSNATLVNKYSTSPHFYINGNTVNDGTITDDASGHALFMRPYSSVENNGSWAPRYTYLESTGSRSYTGTSPIGAPANGQVYAQGSFTVTGDSQLGGPLTINGTMTVSDPDSLTFTSNLYINSGSIAGTGSIALGGGSQSFGGGTITTGELTLSNSGTKTMTANMTLNGNLTIDPSITLVNQNSTSTHFYINGNTVNNGTVTDDASGYALFMRPQGNVENNNGWAPRYTYLEGTNSRSYTGTTAITAPSNGQVYVGGFTVTGTSQLGGPLTLSGAVTVNNSDSLTFKGNTILTGGILGDGEIIFGGGNQEIGGGTINASEVVIGGTNTKTMTADINVSGNLTVNSSVTLINKYQTSTYMTAGGIITNDGIVSDDSSGWALFMRPKSHMYNNTNEWDSLYTYAHWSAVPGASSYDFQVTANGPGAWGSATSTGANTYANIKPYVEENRQWRWRSVTGGTPSEWSEAKDIN